MNSIQDISLRAVEPGGMDAVPAGAFAFEAVHPCGPWADSSSAPALRGRSFTGDYAAVAKALKNLPEKPDAFIFVFTRGDGMEAFLAEVSAAFPNIPSAGGAAFRPDAKSRGAVRPETADVAALALAGGKWRVDSLCFHRPSDVVFSLPCNDPRSFDSVEYEGEFQPARAFLLRQFERMGIKDAPWDRCGILTGEGRLLHMSESGDKIRVSADLPGQGNLRLAFFDQDYGKAQLQKVIRPDSLIFGCAGLHGLIRGERPWEDRHNTAYMYGEVVTLEKSSHFANLSVSILSPS